MDQSPPARVENKQIFGKKLWTHSFAKDFGWLSERTFELFFSEDFQISKFIDECQPTPGLLEGVSFFWLEFWHFVGQCESPYKGLTFTWDIPIGSLYGIFTYIYPKRTFMYIG